MPRVLDLDPSTYERHRIHTGDRLWGETNCYTDVVIELLHGMGFEPLAACPFAFTLDFDVDQWTFFKVPTHDVERLFGVGFHELAPWKPLAVHLAENVEAGRPVLVELDSYYLPDTHGTAYRLANVKSTVAVNAIDLDARRMGYFHNQGYHHLSGEDFTQVLQTEGLVHPRMLPPYIEFVKRVPGATPPRGPALLDASLHVLREQLARVPEANPFLAFRARLERDTEWLMAQEFEAFHTYSFATTRQMGAGYELAATYLRWLAENDVEAAEPAIPLYDELTTSAKDLQLRIARAMRRKKPFDLDPLDRLADVWARGVDHLRRHFG